VRALVLLLTVLLHGLPASPALGLDVEFLYIEPDAGSSGGGHFAIGFDREVYHFRNTGNGFLRLAREERGTFEYIYRVRHNRSIHVARIPLDDAASVELEHGFSDRLESERRNFATLAALEADRRLFAALRRSGALGPSPLPIPGAGFFEPTGNGDPGAESRDVGLRLQSLRPAAGSLDELSVTPGQRGELPTFTSDRFRELAQHYVAFEVLAGRGRLRSDLLRAVDGDANHALGLEERRNLQSLEAQLSERLGVLRKSELPDWGYPYLVALARREAVRASLATGRWVVLDAYPTDARSVAPAELAPSELLRELRADEARRLTEARLRFAAIEPGRSVDERSYAAVEAVANRLLELDAARASGARIRLAPPPLLPQRTDWSGEVPLPTAAIDDDLLLRAESAVSGYREQLRRSYGYHLLDRNCVTEIFRVVESTLGLAGSREALGGYVDPDGFLHFVPKAAFDELRSTFTAAEISRLPSFRKERLESLYADAADTDAIETWLRESNTLTSSLYRGDPEDSAFLFFTEDSLVPRPLFGVANLLVALGETTIGLFTAPFDRGQRLVSGARGAVFSVPELFFVSLRKGRMAYGRREAEALLPGDGSL